MGTLRCKYYVSEISGLKKKLVLYLQLRNRTCHIIKNMITKVNR